MSALLASLPRAVLVLGLAAHRVAPRRAAEPAPKPDTYLCPNATGGAVDCFLDAVEHLYTMCRQVKSIEIIEFGYEKSDEGVNGAKSEYCVDKHRLSMTRPYQAALREATGSRAAVDGLRALHDLWLKALAELKWKPGESDDEYKARIAKPYDGLPRARDRRARRASRPPRPRPQRPPAKAAAAAAAAPAEPRARTEPRRARPPAPTPTRRRPIRELAAIFGDGGALARALPGFRFRPQQLAMAEAVAARHRRRARADRRGRHRHRQDLRLSRPGAALRRQGDRLDRHQDAAGPALPARPAAGARRAARAGDARAAQGPRQLRLPPSSRARRRRGPPAVARRRAAPAEDHRVLARVARPATAASSPTCRRTRRSGRSSRRRATTASASNCALPRRMLRAEGAQGRARGRRRRRQPPPVLRRRDAARRRAGRAAAGLQHGDPRRGAPAARTPRRCSSASS